MAAVATAHSTSNDRASSSAPFTHAQALRHCSQGPGDTYGAAAKDGASCDACIHRNSRCTVNEKTKKCYSCEIYHRDCIFTFRTDVADDIRPRKRKLEDMHLESAGPTKRQPVSPPTPQDRSSQIQPINDVTSLFWRQAIQHIGMTTELEPALLEYLPLDQNDEGFVSASRVRKFGDDGTFVRVVNAPATGDSDAVSLKAIESLVAPYGSVLIEKFFEKVHPVFPILMEDSFLEAYRSRKNLSPLVLSSVYVLALKFLDIESTSSTGRRSDVVQLENLALKLLNDSLPHPSMATIQAGLLLMEKSSLATAALNAQLITAGFELGLHQDCGNWKLETWEKGLRKRMAWALYMQDKWSSLVNGRPSHIFAFNWTVKELVEQDFTDAFHAEPDDEDSAVGHGPLHFCHMVALTTILADILDRFYTLRAMEEFRSAGHQRTRVILDRAKPAQVRLKEWFSQLPPPLKMESTDDLFGSTAAAETARNGALHLSYFATEITLHRCIVRSLNSETTDAYLSHICRSAAKTRLISAMDFVNRLRPAHLRSFWPSSSRTNFSLIGSFGALLRVTAPTREEAEFYRTRLYEYHWTLSVSKKNAGFMDFALASLDNSAALDKHVPEKPPIDDLMASSVKPTTAYQGGPEATTLSSDEVSEALPFHVISSPEASRPTSPTVSADSETPLPLE